MKVVIIGGVAGGASTAARLRRLDEQAQIVMVERGPYISFANCGLPYHLGGVIPTREQLLVMSEPAFSARFNVDVRTRQEATAINRDRKTVTLKKEDGTVYEEPYDRLVLATGSSAVLPPLPGADDPDVYRLWNIPDLDAIMAKLGKAARSAVVVGGGFIGLEAAENLRLRGLKVTVVELLPQILPTLDPEMTAPLRQELARLGIDVRLGTKVQGVRRNADGQLEAELDPGEPATGDLVLMCVGVRPNSGLAKAAGLTLNARSGIVTDDHLRTSDPDIYAVGDVIEVAEPVFGGRTMIPLAGPANRQGRIAADNLAGRDSVYRGTLGTAIVKIGRLAAASVGWTERRLRQDGREFQQVYLHPAAHAGYYPGAKPLDIKLIFDAKGHILGTQIVGTDGTDKRIDVIASAINAGLTVDQLAELELAYAPPFGSAKDPVNLAGMVAGNVLRGDTVAVQANAIPAGVLLLDVRQPEETALGAIPEAINIPLGQLRSRLAELPHDRRIVTYCQVGLRGYVAERILRQHGFDAANLSGGMATWKMFHPGPIAPALPAETGSNCCAVRAETATPALPPAVSDSGKKVDVRGLQCPGPVVRLKQEMDALPTGQLLELLAPATFRPDLEAWCRTAGYPVTVADFDADSIRAVVRKGGAQPENLSISPNAGNNRSAALVLFSNDLDKAMAAFIIASGMAAAGMKVTIFFTFWGLSVLRKENPPALKKGLMDRMFGWMLPRGARHLALSQMNMGGLGATMMKKVMADKRVTALPELIAGARQLGVRFIVCEMAMNVMGLKREELIDDIDEVVGVATFAALVKEGGQPMFI